jgi:SAM-dependent methyltransferase
MPTKRRSNSSDNTVGLKGRLSYLWKLAVMNARRQPVTANEIHREVDLLARRFEALTGKSAAACRVLEVGFGGRPFRAFALQIPFAEAIAVDLDQPVFGAADVPAAIRRNGWTRAVKAFVRSTVFDRGEWPAFHQGLKTIDPSYAPERTRLVVADAGDDAFWSTIEGNFDLVVSFDVFEHIPREGLENLLRHIRRNLAPGGVVMTYPNLFTGIIGGHDPGWYGHLVESNGPETAWRHLWDESFAVDTFLNRMGRRDMAALFRACGFYIDIDRAVLGRLGEKHLTPDIEARLRQRYDDYELFSNRVEFVLSTDGLRPERVRAVEESDAA